MVLFLLYAALAALVVWSVGYLIYRLFRALRGGGCSCGCDCGCCAGKESCGKK